MAGLGLSDAVSGYQQGVEWKQQQDKAAKDKVRSDQLDAINQQSAGVVKQAEANDYGNQRKAWMDGGGDNAQFQAKPFQPPDDMMFKVAHERQTALLKAGLMPEAIQNEAMVQGQRLRVRQNALERFRLGGGAKNPEAAAEFAKVIYGTVPDGKSIVEATTVEGAPGSDGGPYSAIGVMPARPTTINLKLSDGTVHTTTPQEISDIGLRMSDPKYADHEAAINLMRMKYGLEATKENQVADHRAKREGENIDRHGTQARLTEGVKAGFDMSLAHFNKTADGERSAATNRTSLAVAETHKAGQIGSADIRAKSGEGKGVKDPDVAARKTIKEIHTEIIRTIGPQSTALGGGRLGTEDTMTIATIAKKAIDAGAETEDAYRSAIAVFKRNNPGKKFGDNQ